MAGDRSDDPLTRALGVALALGAAAVGAAVAFANSERSKQMRVELARRVDDLTVRVDDLSKQAERMLTERRPEIEETIQRSRHAVVEGLDRARTVVERSADRAQEYVQRASQHQPGGSGGAEGTGAPDTSAQTGATDEQWTGSATDQAGAGTVDLATTGAGPTGVARVSEVEAERLDDHLARTQDIRQGIASGVDRARGIVEDAHEHLPEGGYAETTGPDTGGEQEPLSVSDGDVAMPLTGTATGEGWPGPAQDTQSVTHHTVTGNEPGTDNVDRWMETGTPEGGGTLGTGTTQNWIEQSSSDAGQQMRQDSDMSQNGPLGVPGVGEGTGGAGMMDAGQMGPRPGIEVAGDWGSVQAMDQSRDEMTAGHDTNPEMTSQSGQPTEPFYNEGGEMRSPDTNRDDGGGDGQY